MESAQIATTAGKHEEALAGWLRTAREAALLIEDKTTCGDGSISRIKVTQAYQHALGEVLASSPSAVTKGRMEIHVSHQGSIIRKAALASVKPAPAMREYSGLRVGVPVDVMFAGDTSVPAGRYVAVLLFPSSNGSPVLELRPTQTGGALRLHPPGPLMPLREAAPL